MSDWVTEWVSDGVKTRDAYASKKGTCSHEVVFEDRHYNQAAWKKYAAYVKNLKSVIVIDEEYVP